MSDGMWKSNLSATAHCCLALALMTSCSDRRSEAERGLPSESVKVEVIALEGGMRPTANFAVSTVDRQVVIRSEVKIVVKYSVDDVVVHTVLDGLRASSAENATYPRGYALLYPVNRSGVDSRPVKVSVPLTYGPEKWIGNGSFTARITILESANPDSGSISERALTIDGPIPLPK